MFSRLKMKFRNMQTIRQVCELAERRAIEAGEDRPGAEHFVLAATDLPDGTAREAMQRLGMSPKDFEKAIKDCELDALSALGIDASTAQLHVPDGSPHKLYDAQPSGQDLMQRLSRNSQTHAPLLGSHVISAATEMTEGTVARGLKRLQVDPVRLRDACEAVSEQYRVA